MSRLEIRTSRCVTHDAPCKLICSGGRLAVNALPTTMSSNSNQCALSECVERLVRRYLQDLDNLAEDPQMFDLIMSTAELPLLREVLAWHDGNQSRAAATLGINRATLRKKLVLHGLL